MIQQLFYPGPVIFTKTAGGTTVINQLENVALEEGIEELLVFGAGRPYPSWGGSIRGVPTLPIATNEIQTLLTVSTVGSRYIASGQTYSQVDFYETKADVGGGRVAIGTAAHRRIRVISGMLVAKSLGVQDGQPAVLACDQHIFSTDGTAPFSRAASIAIPSDPRALEVHTLAKISLNGSTLKGIKAVEFDFGNQLDKEAADGDFYPSFGCIAMTLARMTLTFKNPTDTDAYAPYGIPQTVQTDVWFRKGFKGGGLVDVAVAEHLRLSFTADAVIRPVNQGSSGNRSFAAQVVVTPIESAAAVPVTPAFNVIIS